AFLTEVVGAPGVVAAEAVVRDLVVIAVEDYAPGPGVVVAAVVTVDTHDDVVDEVVVDDPVEAGAARQMDAGCVAVRTRVAQGHVLSAALKSEAGTPRHWLVLALGVSPYRSGRRGRVKVLHDHVGAGDVNVIRAGIANDRQCTGAVRSDDDRPVAGAAPRDPQRSNPVTATVERDAVGR